MSVLRRASRLAMLPTAPVLIAQGRRLRRDTPRLPDAAAPWHGSVAGPRPIRLLVLGDSTAAGVGAATQDDALPGNLARELSTRLSRGVTWRAVGENGATSRDIVEGYLGAATETAADLVFLSIGANDALGLRGRGAFVRDIRTIIAGLKTANPDVLVLMSSLPGFSQFVLLPNPLRWNLYLHSTSLEAGARAAVAGMDNVWMSGPPPIYTDGFFATDLFHPSESGYTDWVRFALDDPPGQAVLARLA
ncbi:MAG: SGNH/GDSL hydrolase family protein [Rhodoglobus sp.]